jgi:GAF domain-containing protein
MRILELFEIQGAQGPCLDAFGSGQTVQADEAEGLRRWPEFTPRAAAAGFRVMCAVPLQVRRSVIGALNLFRGTDQRFTAADLEIAKAMADVAAIALIQERALRERTLVTQQLDAALRSRVVIEQAKGMLAEYLNTSVDDAFVLLRGYARDHNLKLTSVAIDVVDRQIPSDALNRRS